MRKVIMGTDWWTDCDDAVAMRLMANAVKNKEIELLGIAINACMEYSVASLQGFLKAEGIENIPIGIDLEATDFGGNQLYQKRLAQTYCPSVCNTHAENALRLYRRLLAATEEKVEIIEIGFPQVLTALLNSDADEFSPKTGLQLVEEKVSKFWVMAGKWDADGEKENNFCRNMRARVAAEAFCRLLPVPVTFLGWEVGYRVFSAGNLNKEDHLYRVLEDHGSQAGRHSWDPMLVLMALLGDEAAAGYSTVRGNARVDEQTGANYFQRCPNGRHQYVVKNYEDNYYVEQINRRL